MNKVKTFWRWMFTKTFVTHVVLYAPKARGVIIRAETCCLYILLTLLQGLQHGLTLVSARLITGSMVPSLKGRSTQGNIIKKFESELDLKDIHEHFLQMWCVCCHKYYITEIFGKEWLLEYEVNYNIVVLWTMRLYWAAVLWKLSFLRRHS